MRNRFEIAPQALLVSAAVILSVILISIMVSQFEQARSLSRTVSQKLSEDTAEMENSDILQYDGITVTGADVRNFCRRYLSSGRERVDKMIVDNGSSVCTYTDTGGYSEMTDPEGSAFVSPADLYDAKVTVNKNGVITDVRFIRRRN